MAENKILMKDFILSAEGLNQNGNGEVAVIRGENGSEIRKTNFIGYLLQRILYQWNFQKKLLSAIFNKTIALPNLPKCNGQPEIFCMEKEKLNSSLINQI